MDLLQNFTRDEASTTDNGRVLTEEEHVLTMVKSLIKSVTRWNFENVKDRLIEAITTAPSEFVLEGLVITIFEKAEEDDAYILFGHLCSELDGRLPRIRSEHPGMRNISFKRLLLCKCQMEFETSMSQPTVYDEQRLKIRLLGTLKLLAQLYKHKMITENICHCIIQELLEPVCVPELYIEATCQLLSSVGKQVDMSPRYNQIFDLYFEKLNVLAAKPQLEPRLRDMIRELLALRVNHWVSFQVKTTASTHSQKEEIWFATASSSNGTTNAVADDGEQVPESDVASLSEDDTSSPASVPEYEYFGIFGQLKKAIAEINTLNYKVNNKERLKHIEARKDGVEAIQKALVQRLNVKLGVIEERFDDEVKLGKETKVALAKEKEEAKSLKQLVDVYKKEINDLKVERDNSLKLTEDLLKTQAEEASLRAMVRLEDPQQPPSSFICPISQEIMNDPQVAADGFSYEAEDMREWLDSGHETSPMTNLKLPHCSLLPNHTLRSAIQEWRHQNR